MLRRRPRSPLFPYTTLFRSLVKDGVPARLLQIEDMLPRGNDPSQLGGPGGDGDFGDRKSTRLNSSHSQISYAVFCLKKKKSSMTIVTGSVLASAVAILVAQC